MASSVGEMPAKNCRHVSQALRLPEFRRALKAHDSLACQLCIAPSAKQNSRARTSSAGVSSKKSSGSSAKSPTALSPSTPQSPAEDASLQGWERSAAWEDLCICITCGFIGCLSGNHFSQHFQINSKHFVGFHAGAKTFWCCPCKQEITEAKAKVEDARRECQESFDEIAAKQQRKIKNRVVVAVRTPTSGKEEETSDGDGEDSVLASGPVDDAGDLPKQAAATATGAENGDTQQSSARKEKRESRKAKASEKSELSALSVATIPIPVSSVLGFTNLGNTCYFNAATQALLTVAHFFPEHVHFDEVLEASNSPVLSTFIMLHETIKKKARRRSVSASENDGKSNGDAKRKVKKRESVAKPDGVLTVAPLLKELRKKFVQFRGSYQQDAHELFMSFLWAIDEEADPPAPAAASEPAPAPAPESPTGSGSAAAAEEEAEAGYDEDDGTGEQKQIFVKTEEGETISMQVPKHATVKDVQRLLAKRLNLDEDDMILDHKGKGDSSSSSSHTPSGRPSSRMSTAKRTQKTFSKLNFARNLFGGELTSVVTCQACGNQSQTVEDAFQLSVSVPSAATSRSLTTIDCLKNFMSETQLLVDAKNGYECEKCSRVKPSEAKEGRNDSSAPPAPSTSSEGEQVVLRDAKMRLVVSQLPRVLVIHIKRLGRLKKITQHIQFDSSMDMAPYIGTSSKQQSTFYELVAVVVHMGNKRSGHYVAYVSRSRKRDAQPVGGDSVEPPSNQHQQQDDSDDDFDPRAEILTSENPSRVWYYISDTVVKRVAFEQVLQCEAYMLFYRQLPPEAS